MLDFRTKLEELIADWNKDARVEELGDKINVAFASYAAPSLRDAAESQFSDGPKD